MPLFSIIVPVFNAEKRLSECIESILNQSVADFELLLINDGSTDSSLDVCNSYAKQDGRIRVLSKENGGVSSARNLGIEKSAGQWIAFIDADDTVSPSYLADFDIINEDDRKCELAITGRKTIINGNEVRLNQFPDLEITLNENNTTSSIEEYDLLTYGTPHGKLFSCSF